MIRHIVLFRFRPDLSNTEIRTVFEAIGALKQHIPQIRQYSWGECMSPENLHKGFLHGFTMDFESAGDRDTYLHHVRHEALVADIILPSLENGSESAMVFDYAMS